jgi:hypothetical protein
MSSTSAIIKWVSFNENESAMSCATKSQMIRMFGYKHPKVKPGKINIF